MVGVNPARAQACSVWARQRSLMIHGSVASRTRSTSSSPAKGWLAGRITKVVVEQRDGDQPGGCGQGGVVEGDGQVAFGVLQQGKRLVGAGLDERNGDIGTAGGQVGEGGGYEGGVAAGQIGRAH